MILISSFIFICLFCVGARNPFKTWRNHIDSFKSQQPLEQIKYLWVMEWALWYYFVWSLPRWMLLLSFSNVWCVTTAGGQASDWMHPRSLRQQIRTPIIPAWKHKCITSNVLKHESDWLYPTRLAARKPSRLRIELKICAICMKLQKKLSHMQSAGLMKLHVCVTCFEHSISICGNYSASTGARWFWCLDLGNKH